MGLSQEYQDRYRDYSTNINKNIGTKPSIPEGVDIDSVTQRVAAEGLQTPRIDQAIGAALEGGGLNDLEIQFLAQPVNSEVVIDSILTSSNPVTLQYLRKVLSLEQQIGNALQQAGLTQAFQNLQQDTKLLGQEAAINKLAEEIPDLANYLSSQAVTKDIRTAATQSDQIQESKGTEKNQEISQLDQSQPVSESSQAQDSKEQKNQELPSDTQPNKEDHDQDKARTDFEQIQPNNTDPVPAQQTQTDSSAVRKEGEPDNLAPTNLQTQPDNASSNISITPNNQGQSKASSPALPVIQDIDSDALANKLKDNGDTVAQDEFLRRNTPEDLREEGGLPSLNKLQPEYAPKTRYTELDGKPVTLPRVDDKDDPESGFVPPHKLRDIDKEHLSAKAERQSRKSLEVMGRNAAQGNTEATEKYGKRALERQKIAGRVKNQDFGEATNPTLGGIADKAKQSIKASQRPKEFAKGLGKKLAKQAIQESVKLAATAVAPFVPWILLFLTIVIFVFGLAAGVFVAVYCYTEELGQERTHAALEYALTSDANWLDRSRQGIALLRGTRVRSTSDIGVWLEENVCVRANPNFCGQTGIASQYGGGNYGAGNNQINGDQCEAFKTYFPFFQEAGQTYNIDPVLLGAIASRETRIGTITGVGGTTGCAIIGDNGFGRGLMQIDTRYHDFANNGSWDDCRANILKGAEILRGFMDQYRNQPLRQQINAYNAGRPCSDGTDGCTTGDDYGSDVLARAADLQICLSDNLPENQVIFHNSQSLASYLTSPDGLRFLLSGGFVQAHASTGSNVDQLVNLISSGEIPVWIRTGVSRDSYLNDLRGSQGIDDGLVNLLLDLETRFPNYTINALGNNTHSNSGGDHNKSPIQAVDIGGTYTPNVDGEDPVRIAEFVQYVNSTGIVKQWGLPPSLQGSVALLGLTEDQWFADGPGHLHISVNSNVFTAGSYTLDANCSCGDLGHNESVPNTLASTAYNTIGRIGLTPLGLQVYAAFGTRPQRYSDISDGHRELLDEVASERGYVGYRDVGSGTGTQGTSPELEAAYQAMFTFAPSNVQANLTIGSGYRSYDTQVGTFFRTDAGTNLIQDVYGEEMTPTEREQVKSQYLARGEASAPPGFSEHSTGLAIDFLPINSSYAATDAYSWLLANASTYGFELSYPEGSTEGAGFEPWHWRFIGNDVYPLSQSLEDLEQSQSSSETQSGECVCTIGSTTSSQTNLAYSWESLKQTVKSVPTMVFGGIEVDAALELEFLSTGTAPREFDLVVSDIDRGNSYYNIVSDKSRDRDSVTQYEQLFFDAVASQWGYASSEDAGGLDPAVFELLTKLQEIAANQGLKTIDFDAYVDAKRNQEQNGGELGPIPTSGDYVPFIASGYVSPGQQHTIFLDTGDPDRNPVERIYDDELDSIQFLYNQALSANPGSESAIIDQMADNGYEIRLTGGASRFDVRIDGEWVSETLLESVKQEVFQNYVNRAYYKPPVGYDDRQTGKFFLIDRSIENFVLAAAQPTIDLPGSDLIVENKDARVVFDPSLVTEEDIPSSYRRGENGDEIYILDWLTLNGPEVGLTIDTTFFGRQLQGTILQEAVDISTPYDIDPTTGSIATDVDGNPITRDDGVYIDPNFSDEYIEQYGSPISDIQLIQDLGRSISGDINASSEENMKIVLLANYIQNVLGYDLNAFTDTNGDGEQQEFGADGDPNTLEDNESYIYTVQNIINIRNANLQRNNINEDEPAGEGQADSPRELAIAGLSDLEQAIFFDLDGDFEIVPDPDSIIFDDDGGEVITRYIPQDSTGIDLLVLEDGFFDLPSVSERDIERDRVDEYFNDDGTFPAPRGINAQEQELFDYYNTIFTGGSEAQEYLSNYTAAVELEDDEIRRFEEVEQYSYFTIDEDLLDSENDAGEGESNEENASISIPTSVQTFNCKRVNDLSLGVLINPLPSGVVTSLFGSRTLTIDGVTTTRQHNGVDFATPGGGGQVVAAAAGTISAVVSEGAGDPCGNYVVIDHGGGLETGYCHLSSFGVVQGQDVNAGDGIGIEGSTGRSTGPHLHFFVNKNGVKVDPCKNGLSC